MAAAPLDGTFVTEVFDHDGGRQVDAYVPPQPVDSVVFAADGEQVARWVGRRLEATDLVSTLVVCAHGLTDDQDRLAEYSPVFDADRFAAHERFFVHDVRAWVRARFDVVLPSDRTAVYGASAGGELALALGLAHPDVYGVVLCASPGAGYRPPPVLPSRCPRTYLLAGDQEPFFAENARRWADALRAAGAEVVMRERPGAHGGEFWRRRFPLMVAWAFEGPQR